MSGMDGFLLWSGALFLAASGAMQLWFCARLLGARPRAAHYLLYIFLLFLLDVSVRAVAPPWPLWAAGELLLLYGVERLGLGCGSSAAWVAAILALYLSTLSTGVVNSVEELLLAGVLLPPEALCPVVAGAFGASLALCGGGYFLALRSLTLADGDQLANAGCLVFPALFFSASESYLMQTAYSQSVRLEPTLPLLLENLGRQAALLVLQLLGLGALLCTLYAYRQLCRSQRAQEESRSLAQAARAQEVYIAEAGARYRQTTAFRHDIQNHLSVLDGLLAQGRLEEGRAYLETLKAASAALSFPWRTGSPVVDILLGEKLELARAQGIAPEVALRLPSSWGVADPDLCVIFANALDNAVRACLDAPGERKLRVAGERQGDFFLLLFQNSCAPGPLPPPGTGLSNIRAAAEKYRGAILTEKAGEQFSLSVLLNIS